MWLGIKYRIFCLWLEMCRLQNFQQHVQVLGVKALNPAVFMTRWALTPTGAVQCFTTVAETLERFTEYDRAPRPQMRFSQAAGCERLHRAQTAQVSSNQCKEVLLPNHHKCKPHYVSSGLVVYNYI